MPESDSDRAPVTDSGGVPDPLPSAASGAAFLDDVPDHIGAYRILDVLGEGGMGMVYLAEQAAPVRRRVALKIIKLGMDTKQVVARFESERQALAVMDHPNIAKVFDGGATATGRPYFVMELVQGTPITAYADTHRLDVDARLRLFMDVCAAVQHAHQKSVIHRDLKPSNVLVTVREAKPVVKVIDFGIAKAMGQGLTDHTLVTRLGQMVGTPEYMSPEQAEMSGLDVDTRTDIYSLGVMLYELLVGVLPFDLQSKPAGTVPYALRERETPAPGTRLALLPPPTSDAIARHRSMATAQLERRIRGDLDWIVLKAMDKDRTRRYDTANEMALDIGRHLAAEPILARPPSARYRLGKFVRRNRNVVLAAGVAAFAVLAGGAATTFGMVRARRAQAEAVREAETARHVSDFLVSLFQVNDPSESRGNTITAREILDRGAEKISAELGDQPVVQARLERTIGDVYRELGLYADAQPLLERAVTLDRQNGDDADLAIGLERLGTLYRQQGNYDRAEPLLRRAVELGRRGLPRDSQQLATALDQLGGLYLVVGRYADAEPPLREALSLRTELFGDSSAAVAVSLDHLYGLYWSQRRFADARPYIERAVAIREKVLPPNSPDIAAGMNNLGILYFMEGKYEAAQRAYERARDIYDAVSPDDPSRLMVLNNLAEVYEKNGRLDEAEQVFRDVLRMKEQRFAPDNPSIGTTLVGLANVLRDQRRFAAAEPLYQRALRVIESARGSSDPSLADGLDDYARMLRAAGRDADAADAERRASAIRGGSAAR